MTTYFVILAEWCIDCEAGHTILGVYDSKEDAIEVLKTRVDTDDRPLAESYGYEVYEDSETCFDSGEDGQYVTNHIYVAIEEIHTPHR